MRRTSAEENAHSFDTPSRPNTRYLAGTFLAVAALVGCAPAQNTPDNQPMSRHESTADSMAAGLSHDYSIRLSDHEWQPLEEFTVGNRTVKILTEREVKSESFSRAQIEKRISQSLALESEGAIELQLKSADEQVGVRFTVVPSAYTEHDFVFLSDPQDVSDVVGLPTSGAITKIHVGAAEHSSGAVSVVGAYPQDQAQAGIKPDDFNLAVEACQNVTGIRLLEATVPLSDERTQVLFTKLAKESVCNGFAFAVAAKQQGYDYDEYRKRSADLNLGDAGANLGMTVPYSQYSRSFWDSL